MLPNLLGFKVVRRLQLHIAFVYAERVLLSFLVRNTWRMRIAQKTLHKLCIHQLAIKQRTEVPHKNIKSTQVHVHVCVEYVCVCVWLCFIGTSVPHTQLLGHLCFLFLFLFLAHLCLIS